MVDKRDKNFLGREGRPTGLNRDPFDPERKVPCVKCRTSLCEEHKPVVAVLVSVVKRLTPTQRKHFQHELWKLGICPTCMQHEPRKCHCNQGGHDGR